MNARSKDSPPLLLALACSLALHAALLTATPWPVAAKKPAPPQALSARLAEKTPTATLPPQPELALPPRIKPPPAARKKPIAPDSAESPGLAADAPAAALAVLTDSARRQLRELDFYPLEAIRNGLEGEALVRIFLDENGNVIAARLEISSGQPILDAAAVNAARRLKSLSRDGLDSALLPVRFRLD
ncbi:MAG: TonB family protein [Zoogloeaceae bacterium]|jgi:protein TonB|nr:TonB family protein [Zoogloeaceae bacterium]